MAPIPITVDADAQALLDVVGRLQSDLLTVQIPRLRACTGPLVTQQAWAAEIREDIEQLAKQLEELDVLVDDQRTNRLRAALRAKVDEHLEALDGLRKESRAAVLMSKRAIDAQNRSQREELLRSPSAGKEASTSNEKVTEDVLMKANSNVTEALQRTIGLMQKELERSVLSTQLLESSTANLHSASQAHDTLNFLINTSKQLVSALEQTDWLDRMLIILALVFFSLVVLFILKQRILDRGLRIAFWWTRFVPSVGGTGTQAGVKVLKQAVDKDARTLLASVSVVSTATAGPSMLASALAATATLSGRTEQASLTLESMLPSIVPSESVTATYSQSTLSNPAHIEL